MFDLILSMGAALVMTGVLLKVSEKFWIKGNKK